MENKIKQLEKVALSNKDISKITDNKCNVMSYTELLNYKTLDDALGQYGALCVLYETSHNFGHWVAVIKVNDKLVEFFDPLSSKPDGEFKFISSEYKKNPYLSHLMKESPYKLSYNDHKFQKNKKGINTCGRHCSIRINLKHLPLEKYKDVMTNSKYDADFIVTVMSELLLKS